MSGPSGGADDVLVVPARFNGPPASGNGGWCAGALAGRVTGGPGSPAAPGGAVDVRLSAPPPLEEPLALRPVDGGLEAWSGDVLVMTARAAGPDAPPLPVVEAVEPAAARAAAGAYRGAVGHPFPTCFACGPARRAGDGLRLTPGVLADRPIDTACVWVPGMDVDAAQVWSALDCPGGWSVDLAGRPMVLGSISLALHRVPAPGQECVVVGRALGGQAPSVRGRTARTAATLWSDGEVLATAQHVWVAVDPALFAELGRA